jgi:hypothetical protein
MSFEVDLDYSEATGKLGAVKSLLEARVVAIDDELTVINNSVGFEAVLANRANALNNVKSSILDQIATIDATLAEIVSVQALSAPDKQKLYDFYFAAEVTANKYMQIMLFNTTAMLADADITAILADNTNPPHCKCHICQSILVRYPINQTNTFAIMLAFM